MSQNIEASTPVTHDDGWCGHCGAVFIDRPSTAPDACDACGKPLSTNPPGGPVPPRKSPVTAGLQFVEERLASSSGAV
jgi:hypothetical protein